MTDKSDRRSEFNIENALSLYAYSYFQFDADQLYNKNAMSQFSEVAKRCHIYIIGFLPRLTFYDYRQEGSLLVGRFRFLSINSSVSLPMPEGYELEARNGKWRVKTPDGAFVAPPPELMLSLVSDKHREFSLDVKYIGQSYGNSGSSNAIIRLQSHDTFQKIAIKGVPI